MAMEELDLPKAGPPRCWLRRPRWPMSTRSFLTGKFPTWHVVRDSIEQRAEAALDAQRELPL